MRMTGLNFDSIPALNVPLRFYLTAPLFAISASYFLFTQGSLIWLSRWLPATLAFTHMMALGVMAMVMIGSLFQVMPVLCGAPIRIGSKALILMHSGLVLGVVALCAAFMGWVSFAVGGAFLALSLGYFIITLVWTLLRDARGEQTRFPILFSVIAFACAVLAGVVLVSGHLWGIQLFAGKALTHFHASAAIFGWVLLLIMAVSFQVIPMFHVTPVFPRFWRNVLLMSVVSSLIAMLFFSLLHWPTSVITLLLAAIGIGYAVLGLHQLRLRKRKLPDVVIDYWRAGFCCLITGCLAILVLPFLPEQWQVKTEILLALLIGLGFVLGIIQGMLLKIVPFLITLHLQKIAMKNPASMMLLPDHYQIISRQQGRDQFVFYLLLLLTLLVSFCYSPATLSIGVALIINWLCVGYNLVKASRVYHRTQKEMLNYV